MRQNVQDLAARLPRGVAFPPARIARSGSSEDDERDNRCGAHGRAPRKAWSVREPGATVSLVSKGVNATVGRKYIQSAREDAMTSATMTGNPTTVRRFHGSRPPLLLQVVAGLAALAREMSFIEHLEELRRRLIWSVVFIVAAFGLCWIAVGDLLNIASAPIRAANPGVTLALSRLQDIVGLNVKVTLVASLFVSAPFVLTQ